MRAAGFHPFPGSLVRLPKHHGERGFRSRWPARYSFTHALSTFLALFLLLSRSALASSPLTNSISLTHVPPRIAREFRGAWIASTANIDWPSKPGLPVEKQKEELRALMNKAVELRLNALILQVRPFCDAFYQSSIEPWSIYLTGEMGKAPDPAYDPLKYAIEQAHARGLELHAWFNPYRAGLAHWKYAANHIFKRHPRLVRRYGNLLWLDPTEQAVQDHATRVILDVVKRYDIDGVHLDDYFYPYPQTNPGGALVDFPDDTSWAKYRASGGRLARGDWRRDNVNKLVRRLKTEIQAAKSWVTFGISPFGIWRPGYPRQIKGLDAYEHLYADARHWLTNGWVDYLAPQLYWTIDRPETSYSALLDWWRQQDQKGIPIWPGGAVTHVTNPALDWPASEILRQIDLSRAAASPGYVHWNLSALIQSPPALRDALRASHYQELALVPTNPGDEGDVPKPAFRLKAIAGKHQLTWSVPPAQRVAFWLLQIKDGADWRMQILPPWQREISIADNPAMSAVALSFLSRHRNLSAVALRTF
jgi:uncharacterized lipoprotein YddW (UPF0748 family)